MQPGARVQAVAEILAAVEAPPGAADDVIRHEMRGRHYAGSSDRRFIQEAVHALLKRRARAEWWISRTSAGQLDSTPRRRALLHALLDQRWSVARLAAECDGSRHHPAPLDDAELELARALDGRAWDDPEMPRAVRLECPAWLEPLLARACGADVELELAALLEQAPLDLRVNLLKGSREDALRMLREEGVAGEPTPLSPLGVRLRERVPLSEHESFTGGLLEVQDESSQVGALLVGARPGERVVDFCAGACGKTLALAAAMGNRGRIVALDVSEARLSRAAPRLRRAGVHCVERRAISTERDPWVKRHAGGFDRVLVDAPCTGTGTWRRHPESRWRLEPGNLASLVETQRRVVESALRLVRPGGRFVYSTCSLLREENEAQVEWLMAAHPELEQVPAAEAWRESLPGPCPTDATTLRLTPARHGCDGFFVALFRRREG